MRPKDFELLVDAFKSLPSISTKTANKIAYYLLNQDNSYFFDFLNRLENFKKNLKLCELCNNLSEGNLLCTICNSNSREKHKLCIVSSVEDLEKIENSEVFSGCYYVLHGELNQKDLTSTKKINLKKLDIIINHFNVSEILIATNMTINGELTSNFIRKHIEKQKFNIDVYRLALGIPMNSSIDYVDWESLKYSIKHKRKI